MKTIKIKLVLLYILLVFLVMVVSSTFILFKFRSDEALNAEQGLINSANSIYEEVINSEVYIEDDFQYVLNDIFRNQSTDYSNQIVILNDSGSKIIAQTAQLESTAIPVIISAANGLPKFEAWRKDTSANGTNREWFEYAIPADDYIIFVRSDASNSTEALSSMAGTLLLALIIALIITGLFGSFFANTLTQPIAALTNQAKELASGNIEGGLQVYSNDEIGQLTETFNYMAKELKFNIDSISTEKNKLEIILHNMNDGVLAYSSSGMLIHANSAVVDILSEDVIDLSLEQFFEKYDYTIDEKEKDQAKIIPILDKFVSFNIKRYENFYDKTSGVVIVLQDITKHKKLDDMRKEFVANVSHELRTPLTTVKSYTETLIDEEIKNEEIAMNFLNVINGEVDRMAVLVQDLLDLSKFDSEKMILIMEELDLRQVIERTINQNRILIEKKNQSIYTEFGKEKYVIDGDIIRINQVFNNVISNAIKYSPENESISVRMSEDEKNYTIFIKDTGIGIPKEDINHIFERFYRVDKARSRQMGGTGLGLAITKEIMEVHGGSIRAESELGKGTTMIIRFKKKV